MHLSPEEERLIRMFRSLDDVARNTYMVTLGKSIMDQYAVNIGVTLCESDRLAQQRSELSDEIRHQYEERLWAAHPPLMIEGQDVSDGLIPLLRDLPLLDIILGYPWDSSDMELVEFVADEIFGREATAPEMDAVGRWLGEWREGVLTSIELQSAS